MDTLNRLLAAAQQACDPPTVVALKERLGVSRQTIYDWKTSATTINDDHLARLIELAMANPDDAVAVRKERARSDHERALWRGLLRRLGAAATLAVVALLNPPAASAEPGSTPVTAYYVIIGWPPTQSAPP